MSATFARIHTENISAIQVLVGEDGCQRMGLLTQITPNADLRVSGSGFNEKTVQVEFGGCPFFVFREDLEARFGSIDSLVNQAK